MTSSQETKKEKKPIRATIVYRIVAGGVFVGIAGFFVYMFLGGRGIVDLRSQFGYCGFKQSYGLPCPGCGWTTSTLAFVDGRISEAFYIQPAAAFFCLIFGISAIFALLSAVFGIRFSFLDRPFGVIVKYVVISVLIIVASGWMVTLARALAARGS